MEDGIAGVEHEFQTGNFLDETQCMLCGEPAPVHTIFVNGLQARVGEARNDLAQAAKAFGLELILAPWLLRVGHDANQLGAEALHAWDGALDFAECDSEVRLDRF